MKWCSATVFRGFVQKTQKGKRAFTGCFEGEEDELLFTFAT